MLRLTRISEERSGAADGALRLRLAYHERARSRLVVQEPSGPTVAIVLPRGTVLRDGMVLASDDGALAIVEAAREPLTRVTADDAGVLMRAVYHLANRHVPVQLARDHLLLERDAVLERMLAALGARVEPVELPFDPEPGAYHGHEHSGHRHRDEPDPLSATVGEQLSIEAHRARSAGA